MKRTIRPEAHRYGSPTKGHTMRRIALLLAILGALSTIVVASNVVPAAAECRGTAAFWNGPSWASETTGIASTCDNNDLYSGKVRDDVTDSNCVDLYSKDDIGSVWGWEARECTTGGWENYSWDYSDGDAYFKVCKHIAGTCSPTSGRYNWGF